MNEQAPHCGRSRAVCNNAKTISEKKVVKALTSYLRKNLGRADMIELFHKEVTARLAERCSRANVAWFWKYADRTVVMLNGPRRPGSVPTLMA